MSSHSGPYREPPAWLARIPGYRGYHDKEQRRLADRALREELARRVRAAAEQVQQVSAELARARRFDDLTALDALGRRVRHLGDRLQTVPEGYRGLFDREQVDEAALEQLIAFDQALAAGVERLNTLASQLSDQTPSPILDGPAGREIVELTDRLLQRLDGRSTVISQGQPLPAQEALAVLAEPVQPAPEITLAPGDALSYVNRDYLVDAVISYRGDRSWSEYRLRDGADERWLVVTPTGASLLASVGVTLDESAAESVTLDGTTYRLTTQGQATATLAGPSGDRKGVPVTFRDYQGADAAGTVLAVRDWGDERRVLQGEPIERELLSVYPRVR